MCAEMHLKGLCSTHNRGDGFGTSVGGVCIQSVENFNSGFILVRYIVPQEFLNASF